MTVRKGKTVWEGAFLKVLVEGRWEYVRRKGTCGAVAVLPITAEGMVVLLDEYRVPVQRRVVALPAGLVGDEPGIEEEPLEEAARRELLEEAGYKAASLEKLVEGVVTAGMSDEYLTFFLARGCTRIGPGGGDGTEDIVVHEVPFDEVLDWIDDKQRQGALVDIKSLALLRCWLRPPERP